MTLNLNVITDDCDKNSHIFSAKITLNNALCLHIVNSEHILANIKWGGDISTMAQ